MYSFGSESTIPHAMNSLLFSTLRLVFFLTLLADSVASVRLRDLVYSIIISVVLSAAHGSKKPAC